MLCYAMHKMWRRISQLNSGQNNFVRSNENSFGLSVCVWRIGRTAIIFHGNYRSSLNRLAQ